MPVVTVTVSAAERRANAVENPAAYAALGDALAAFRAHGETAGAMIARLGAILDRLEALPHEDGGAWSLGVARYLACRYGPLPRPLPPGAWPWGVALRAQQMAGWGVAIVCRQAYRALSAGQRERADADYGPLTDARGSDNPLWVGCYPQREEEALDRRAAALGVDVLARQRLAHGEALRKLAATKAARRARR